MMMRVIAPHFVAGAEWVKNSAGYWECVLAAPIIKYMVGMSANEVKSYLRRKEWLYEWLT